MENANNCIRSACARFACRLCRTKTGWPHQSWCELRESETAGCDACRYFDAAKGRCVHPAGKAVIRT